jgi:hypothetical protein
MIEKMLEVLSSRPDGHRIVSITVVRDGAVIVTDRYVYYGRPDASEPFGFVIHHDPRTSVTDLAMALWLEWLSWHGAVLHPYVDRTVLPLISWADLGMRLSG